MMAGCGCGASFEAGLWETMKWGALFGAKKGILKGRALGAGYGSLGGPLGTYIGGYVGGVIGGALGTALGGLIGAGGAWGAHILFSQCGCSPLCLCFPSRWQGPQPAPARRDPLVLDLNRDGKVELKNTAFFDLNANGFHEFTRWIDKTDAFLVLDKNFNGKADDRSELFGDAMTLPDGSLALTGFDALKAYDSNGDGKIDASDEIYASLKVLTGEGKMSSLADAGVKSLNLASEVVNESTPPALSQSDLAKLTWDERVLALKDQAREADRALWKSGGSIRAKGTFEWQDGSTGTIAETLPCIEGEQEFLRKLDDTRNDVWFCGVAT